MWTLSTQALWTLMQLGQFLTGVIAGMKIGTLEQDFWFYSGLMAVFTLVFVAITLTYQVLCVCGARGCGRSRWCCKGGG